MKYGTIELEKSDGTADVHTYVDGSVSVVRQRHTEYIKVANDQEALSVVIAFMRDASMYHYRDPVIEFVYDKQGIICKILQRYVLTVDA